MFLFPSLCGPVYRPAGVRQPQATDAPPLKTAKGVLVGKPTQRPPSALDWLAGGKALKVGLSWTDQVVRFEATGEFSKVGRIFFSVDKNDTTCAKKIPRFIGNSHERSAEMCLLMKCGSGGASKVVLRCSSSVAYSRLSSHLLFLRATSTLRSFISGFMYLVEKKRELRIISRGRLAGIVVLEWTKV